jgi:hypothetical protein
MQAACVGFSVKPAHAAVALAMTLIGISTLKIEYQFQYCDLFITFKMKIYNEKLLSLERENENTKKYI